MTLIHRFIQAGFAVAALASASVPALAWTVWPDVDFEWYANVGKAPVNATVEVFPAARPPRTPRPRSRRVADLRAIRAS